jgi:hypothetical protein
MTREGDSITVRWGGREVVLSLDTDYGAHCYRAALEAEDEDGLCWVIEVDAIPDTSGNVVNVSAGISRSDPFETHVSLSASCHYGNAKTRSQTAQEAVDELFALITSIPGIAAENGGAK